MELSVKHFLDVMSKALSLLTYEQQPFKANPSFVTISNIHSFKEGLFLLKEHKLCENEVDNLLSNLPFSDNVNSRNINISEAATLRKRVDDLREKLEEIIVILRRAEQKQPIESVNIKLPIDVTDLASLSKAANDIDRILDQLIVNNTINGQKKIVSVENGSIWLNLLVGSLAVGLIGKVAWAASVICNKITEVRANQEFNRGLKLKNTMMEEMVKLHKTYIDQLTLTEAELIADEDFANDPDKAEQVNRIKLAISELADLIFRGAEIRPAINAPEDVKNLFPQNLITTVSRVKEIESRNSE